MCVVRLHLTNDCEPEVWTRGTARPNCVFELSTLICHSESSRSEPLTYPSSGSLLQRLAKNYSNDSIVSVDMDMVGVMAAYSERLCLCAVHCI